MLFLVDRYTLLAKGIAQINRSLFYRNLLTRNSTKANAGTDLNLPNWKLLYLTQYDCEYEYFCSEFKSDRIAEYFMC